MPDLSNRELFHIILKTLVASSAGSSSTPNSRTSDKSATIKELVKANSKGQGILGRFPESVSDYQLTISHTAHRHSDDVPKSVMKLLLYAQDTFGVSKDVFDAMLANALFTCSPGALSHEFHSLRQLLKLDLSATDPSVFKSHEQYNIWKTGEMQSMEEQIKAMALDQSLSADITAFVSLSVKEGKDMKSKSKSNENHSYIKIFYDGQVYTSPIFRDSLEPKWDFKVVLAVRNQDEPVLITTWLYLDQKQEEVSHNFLGMVLISGRTLLDYSSWVSLGKRSTRSHVSGEILLQAEKLQLSRSSVLTQHLFNWIPSDSEQAYFHILRRCLVQDLDLLQTGHETEAFELLAELSKKWRVSPDFHTGVLFDELVEFVSRGKIGMDYLDKKVLDDAIQSFQLDQYVLSSVRNVSRNCSRLLTISEAQIKGFFGTIASIRNPRQLFTLPIVLEKLQRIISPREALNVPVQVEVLLDKSMLSRIQEFASQAEVMSDSMTASSFLKLLQLVNQDLESIARDYDLLLLNSIYVSRVCAHAFIRYLTPLLSDFATFYSRGSIEMAEGFEIYNASLKFEHLCVNIDSGMKSFFNLSDWFRPVIKDWFKVSESKMQEWTTNAIKLDKFEQTTTFSNSSSLFDILTSIQQQLDFVQNLRWPNRQDKELMREKMYQNISLVLVKYCQTMTDLLASDFKNPALGGPKEKKKDFMKKIKFKIKMKSSKKNIFNPEETRLSPRMCVKLVNVHNLGTVFSRLKPGPVDPLVKDDTPFSSKDALFDMSDRIMFKLTICNGSDLRVMRPWVTRISVRVSDSLGKLVGISEPKVQNSVMNWNDSIFGVAPASSVTLKFLFDVMQQVQETKKEYLFASGKAEFGLFDGEQDVAISSYGSIKVSLEIISTFTKDFSETIVKKQVQASKNRLISLIVEQLCHDFKSKFKKALLDKSGQPLKNMLASLKLTQTPVPTKSEEVDSELGPFLEYLNTNFELLTDCLEESLAFEVIKAIWERIVAELDSLLVPGLHLDAGSSDKAMLDETSVAVFRQAFMSIAAFFHGEGSGLSNSAMKTPRSVQFQLMLDNHNSSRLDLESKFLALSTAADFFIETEDGLLSTDWILKLLKAKGHLDSAEKGLKARAGHQVLKSFSL